MTREEAKRRAELYSALAEGKTIQVQNPNEGEWFDVKIETLRSICEEFNYRIKPEQRHRPFKTQEECWNEMLKHQPFGWVKSKKNGRFYCIGEVSWSEGFGELIITFSTNESLSRCSDSVYKECTFPDNSPFGIKEE